MTKKGDPDQAAGWRPWRRRHKLEGSPDSDQPEESEEASAQQPGVELGEAASGSPAPQYSRAFENIVTGSDDLVGLLAYALFKEAVHEEARQGNRSPGGSRNPTRATVEAFRMAAEQRITDVVNRGIEEATPSIQQTATNVAISGATSDLKAHVTQRTGFGMALLTNILAWAVTLAIAVMILFIANRGSVEDAIMGKADNPALSSPHRPKSVLDPTKTPTEVVNRQ